MKPVASRHSIDVAAKPVQSPSCWRLCGRSSCLLAECVAINGTLLDSGLALHSPFEEILVHWKNKKKKDLLLLHTLRTSVRTILHVLRGSVLHVLRGPEIVLPLVPLVHRLLLRIVLRLIGSVVGDGSLHSDLK